MRLSILEKLTSKEVGMATTKVPRVIFVLGGPGSGKGTQCQMICQNFSFVHFSVGDLLREEASSGSKLGYVCNSLIDMSHNFDRDDINEHIIKGDLVPSQISVTVLITAMNKSGTKRFLVDGFPRAEPDRIAFEQLTGIIPDFVLYYDCPEEELVKRLLKRGRKDDTEEAIKERLGVFHRDTHPVVDHYEDKGLLRRVNACREVGRVFNTTKTFFISYTQDELLEVSQQLLDGIDAGDYSIYEKLCDPDLTAFEPEAQGQLVEKLPFHKFYFGIRGSGTVQNRFSTIAAPKVTMVSEDAAVVTYTRLMQERGIKLIGFCDAYNETRVWKRKWLENKRWEWRHIHFHRSKAPTELGHTCVDL